MSKMLISQSSQALRARPCCSIFGSRPVSSLGLWRREVPSRGWWQPGQGQPSCLLWQEGAAGGDRANAAQGGLEEDASACTLWIQSQSCLYTCKASSTTSAYQTFWICWWCACAQVGTVENISYINFFREGAEMLKYQFPDSWWKDSRPAHCW